MNWILFLLALNYLPTSLRIGPCPTQRPTEVSKGPCHNLPPTLTSWPLPILSFAQSHLCARLISTSAPCTNCSYSHDSLLLEICLCNSSSSPQPECHGLRVASCLASSTLIISFLHSFHVCTYTLISSAGPSTPNTWHCAGPKAHI